MDKTEIILTKDLLVINEHDLRNRTRLELMLTVDYKNKTYGYDLVFEQGGDWTYFEDAERSNPEFVEEWMPGAIRDALEEMDNLEWLSDDIAESEDWDYFREWADSAEATLKNNLVELVDQVWSSRNLRDLRDNLEELEKALEDRVEKIEELVDLSNLDTFGGEDPDDTSGIYSWDETDQLVQGSGMPGDNWNIEEREDLE